MIGWKGLFRLLRVCIGLTVMISLLSFIEVFMAIGICVTFGLVIPPLYYMWTLSMAIYFLVIVTGVIRV